MKTAAGVLWVSTTAVPRTPAPRSDVIASSCGPGPATNASVATRRQRLSGELARGRNRGRSSARPADVRRPPIRSSGRQRVRPTISIIRPRACSASQAHMYMMTPRACSKAGCPNSCPKSGGMAQTVRRRGRRTPGAQRTHNAGRSDNGGAPEPPLSRNPFHGFGRLGTMARVVSRRITVPETVAGSGGQRIASTRFHTAMSRCPAAGRRRAGRWLAGSGHAGSVAPWSAARRGWWPRSASSSAWRRSRCSSASPPTVASRASSARSEVAPRVAIMG